MQYLWKLLFNPWCWGKMFICLLLISVLCIVQPWLSNPPVALSRWTWNLALESGCAVCFCQPMRQQRKHTRLYSRGTVKREQEPRFIKSFSWLLVTGFHFDVLISVFSSLSVFHFFPLSLKLVVCHFVPYSWLYFTLLYIQWLWKNPLAVFLLSFIFLFSFLRILYSESTCY